MAVTGFEIHKRGSYDDGREFGSTGAYERIDGTLTFTVDPGHEANRAIIDLELAPRDAQGRVQFQSDLTLIAPLDRSRGNGRALVELPNRGRKLIPRHFNRSATEAPPSSNILPGDGFLFRHGYTVGWIGWQWDVFRNEALMGLDAPQALIDNEPVQGLAVVEIHPTVLEKTRLLANRQHQPNLAANVNDPDAMVTVRDWEDGPETILPRDQWSFARETEDGVVPSTEHIYMEAGFEPGKLYHVVYTAHGAPVVGAGLLAVRDVASFLKSTGESNPVSGSIEKVYGFGMSQTGRMLRHYLYLGLNVDEDGQMAYDGLIPHVAGARRGEFNHRFAQPSVQSTPGFGHTFPFADEAMEDIYSPSGEGLLSRQREAGHVPKIIYINTSAEYWRGDSSLMHTDPAGKRDIEPSPESGIYLFASTQHGPGMVPQTDYNPNDGGRGRYGFNTVEYTPLLRAALVNLDRWVTDGTEPPESAYPRLSDGSAVAPVQVLEHFRSIPGMHLPDPERLPALRQVDLGPDAGQGIGHYPVREGERYPAYVSNVDSDSNEIAGLRLPDLTVPLGTHAGWNPRHPETGGPEQIMSMQGFTQFFARTRAEGETNDDPRPSIEERYPNKESYLSEVRNQAELLAHDRYILSEDIDLIVSGAAERWDHHIST
ncbi:alpha/beta hydrolase domain-containing protein [soil metagenome]